MPSIQDASHVIRTLKPVRLNVLHATSCHETPVHYAQPCRLVKLKQYNKKV
jgi:hypothetical protein